MALCLSLLSPPSLSAAPAYVCVCVFVCVCVQTPRPADTFSISLLSAGQRHINAPLSFKKSLPPPWPATSTPAFLGFFFFRPPRPGLSYNLSQAEMADKCPCCGYNPSTPVSLFLSLSLPLSLMCDVKMVTQRSAALLQYHKITR